MILLCGIPTEGPLALAIEAASDLGIHHHVFDQREYRSADLRLEVRPGQGVLARLRLGDDEVDLDTVSGVYARLMDDSFLPGVAGHAADHPDVVKSRIFHDRFNAWLNIAQCRVANRPTSMLSNMSKTYQASIIRRSGFLIPETLVTTDPDAVRRFADAATADGAEVIYKSVSGVRSIVQTLTPADYPRLKRISWCPTQFQRRVAGTDLRVHVVGTRHFAVEIASDAVDYRYARRQTGADAELSAAMLPPDIAARCVTLANALDLPFAGIDLRRTPEGEYVCFEVNPSPAYSYYETYTGLPIARGLVSWLAGL